MVTVVGKDTSMVKRVSCRSCASILEYTEAEVKSSKRYDYTGDFDTIKTIDCPCCGVLVRVQ